MDEKMLEQEVEITLSSLDAIERCRPSPGFADRVAQALRVPEETPSWLPNLAMATVVLLFFLDGAAMALSWQSRQTEVPRQRLIQMTQNSLWVDPPGFSEDRR